MPIFTYDCQKCGSVQEHLTDYQDRDGALRCAGACGGVLVRRGVELFTTGKPSFQTNAILGSGKKVAGQFGKSGRKAKGWHRP
jgi:predicted nucleic acid-binding Zn ribbon protein